VIDIAAARSMLFVPGTRTDRFDRAATSGADGVILDLEDSVAAAEKTAARNAVRSWLDAGTRPVSGLAVRVNAVGTPWHDADLRMAAATGCAVVLPKADAVETLRSARAQLSGQTVLVALIETARGISEVAKLCDSRFIDRVAFGSVDLAVELGLDPVNTSPTITHARSAVVVASAAAGLPQPLDGVTSAVDDFDRLSTDLQNAVSIGFGGKLAIHPRQVDAINHAWTPTRALLSWAEQVIAAAFATTTDSDHSLEGGEVAVGVTTVDGHMVDLPVITRARQILTRAANANAQPTTAGSTAANGAP
jgi:citrate lyase subunit beta / citryl-CoA lyase